MNDLDFESGNAGGPENTSPVTPFSPLLMDLLQSAQAGAWIRVDGNFEEVKAPVDLVPNRGNPSKIIDAWGAMAYNPAAGDIMITGGGHANYRGNDVYAFSILDLEWRRLSLPSDVVADPDRPPRFETVDGPEDSPISSHLYDGLAYLQVADRMLSFGGAAFNDASYYTIEDPVTGELRRTGPYTFDPNKADGNKVGGLDFSGVDPTIEGTQAWENRDSVYRLEQAGFNGGFAGTSSHAFVEDGKDVILFKPQQPPAPSLWKLTINDPDNPDADTYELVGLAGVGSGAVGGGSYDPGRQYYLQVQDTVLVLWDLSSDSLAVSQIIDTVLIDGVTEFRGDLLPDGAGIDYDPIRDQFVLWGGDNDIYAIDIPEDPGDIWTVEVLSPDAAFNDDDFPDFNVSSVHGKWEYIPDYDVFVGLVDPVNGDISIYKPFDWQPTFLTGPNPIAGTNGSDQLVGTLGDDRIDAKNGDDALSGLAGDDILLGSGGSDSLFGGDGDDLLRGGVGVGDDSLSGGTGADTLKGGDGDDLLRGGEGDDQLEGAAGRDMLNGDAGDDLLQGGEGDDHLYGNAGRDTLNGGDGNDVMFGAADADSLHGGAGNDTLAGGGGFDQVAGNLGDDRLVYYAAGNQMAADRYFGGDGFDTLELRLTADQHADSTLQADLQAFHAWLDAGEGSAFAFNAFALQVWTVEAIEVVVDGLLIA